MKNRSHIDLTPLLDVILLLVFGFLFVLASTNTQLAGVKADLETSTADSQAAIKALEAENERLALQVENLQEALAASQATAELTAQGAAEYFSLNQNELAVFLSQQSVENASAYLAAYADAGSVAKNMVMYELLANEFYFVEVVLNGEDNRILINGEKTSVNIRPEDIESADAKTEKKQAVKDIISGVIDSRTGGSSMVFVTLSTDNPEVYHYAWALTWQAVSELSEKYGAKNYYSAELFIKENLSDE